MNPLNVKLSDNDRRFIERQIKGSKYKDESSLIAAALDALRLKEKWLSRVSPAQQEAETERWSCSGTMPQLVPSSEFWKKFPELVSSSDGTDSSCIRAAFKKPDFEELKSLVIQFGFERLEVEWENLCNDPNSHVFFVKPDVTRILHNLKTGYMPLDKLLTYEVLTNPANGYGM